MLSGFRFALEAFLLQSSHTQNKDDLCPKRTLRSVVAVQYPAEKFSSGGSTGLSVVPLQKVTRWCTFAQSETLPKDGQHDCGAVCRPTLCGLLFLHSHTPVFFAVFSQMSVYWLTTFVLQVHLNDTRWGLKLRSDNAWTGILLDTRKCVLEFWNSRFYNDPSKYVSIQQCNQTWRVIPKRNKADFCFSCNFHPTTTLFSVLSFASDG